MINFNSIDVATVYRAASKSQPMPTVSNQAPPAMQSPNGVTVTLSKEADSATTEHNLKGLPALKIYNAQDVAAFEQQLAERLDILGVDPDIPLKLTTDYAGRVVVEGNHPNKQQIEKMFENDPDLRNGLVGSMQHFLFKKLTALQAQAIEKMQMGMSEEMANLWLIDQSKKATALSAEGITYSDNRLFA